MTHVGKARTVNQDNYYCCGNYRELEQDQLTFDDEIKDGTKWIAAVFDGMGGEKDGEIASLIAGRETYEYCICSGDSVDVESLIEQLNDSICREMDTRKSRMGSTCVFLEFDDGQCRSWNVGDSRAYCWRDGELTQMSKDHTEAASYRSIFGREPEAGRAGENRLTQNLGIPKDDFLIEPSVSDWMTVKPYDVLLLCSDGLTHMIRDEEIEEVLGSDGRSAQEKKTELLELALERGGKDNITIILAEAYN